MIFQIAFFAFVCASSVCALLPVRNTAAVGYRVPQMKTDAAFDEGDNGTRKIKLAAPNGVAEMNRFSSTAALLDVQLVKVSKKIRAVEKEIKAVEKKNRSVKKEIKAAASFFLNATGIDKQYWMEEKRSLMEEKRSIMEEERSLMEEKRGLMDREKGLVEEKLRASLVEPKQTNLFRIPEDIPLLKPINECTFPDMLYQPKSIVGMETVVQRCLAEIRNQYSIKTDGDKRKPPLAISRLARGGKTTALGMIFNAVKASDMDVNAVYINFNGNFSLREGETQAMAILRLIAAQLICETDVDLNNIVCNQGYLEKYIAASGRPFILFVDELNSLGYPLQIEAAMLLRNMFLDPAGRYLVFSTHLYLTVDTAVDAMGATTDIPSPRELILVDLPISYNLTELRAISPVCSSLTAEEAQLYGGIPSLIFCSKSKNRDLSPKNRFARFVRVSKIETETRAYIYRVMECFFTGSFLTAAEDVKMLCSFSSVNDDDGETKARWPLVYISSIISFLSELSSTREVVGYRFSIFSSIITLFEEFKNDATRIGSGMGWQSIVHIAILMRSVQCYAGLRNLDIFGIELGRVTSIKLDRLPTVKTMDDAKIAIEKSMKDMEGGSVVLFYPLFANFPLCESFFVYKSMSSELLIYPIQVKLGKNVANEDIPSWTTCGLLVGGVREKRYDKRNGWIYLSREQIDDYLGYSLRPLHPSNWNE